MRKITADISQNTATVADEFTNGNPSLTVPATILPAEWLNTYQRELVNLVEGAGLTLNPANDGQVLAAVQALISTPSAQINRIFDAIVGTGAGCTHATLAAAIAAVAAGSRILVTESVALAASITVNKANLLIEFKPGVTYSKNSVSKGLIITSGGVRVKGGRFSGFSTSGDKAIEIQAGATYCFVSECRFATNDTDVDDATNTAAIFGNIVE